MARSRDREASRPTCRGLNLADPLGVEDKAYRLPNEWSFRLGVFEDGDERYGRTCLDRLKRVSVRAEARRTTVCER